MITRKMFFLLMLVVTAIAVSLQLTGAGLEVLEWVSRNLSSITAIFFVIMLVVGASRSFLIYLETKKQTLPNPTSKAPTFTLIPVSFGPVGDVILSTLAGYVALQTSLTVLNLLFLGVFRELLSIEGVILLGIQMFILLAAGVAVLVSLLDSCYRSPLFVDTRKIIPADTSS